MMTRTGIRNQHARGFSLLELLLAIGVFTSVMMGVMALLQTYAERELARATNRYMASVMEATRQILYNPVNFNVLYEAAAAAGGGYQLIADATDSTDNIMNDFVVTTVATGAVTIQGTRLLNENFTQNAPIRAQVRILLRIADAPPPNETDIRALEIIVVTRTPRPDSIVQKAASEGGYHGGWIRTYPNKASALMVGAFNGWRVQPSSRLNNTNWYQNDLLGSADSNTEGSYLVYYGYANLADITSDYLYRTPDPSADNRLNTMYGPINMGSNDIIGADDVYIGNGATVNTFAVGDANIPDECEGGVMCVDGIGIVKGSASISGNMTVTGSALVADSSRFGTMRVQNGIATLADKQTYGAQGLLVVDGDEDGGGGGTTDTVTVTGGSTFQDGMTVNDGTLGVITGTSVAMPEGGILKANRITAARRISATTIHADSLTTTGQLKTGIVTGGNVDVTGRSGIIDISDMNNLQYGSAGSIKTIGVPRLRVDRLSTSNFGACGDCPN